ncbi:uncharacterized protein LOC129741631 [Uranotaenia lowii]|uniref:uncharacterized protein LOC129741631 n=1 Tax=Uranotaenia lowii TaxID=190385 RepID=UPI002478D2DF|nr:uncharacterized protein LOC129741631 [Uranotaenia lowii]
MDRKNGTNKIAAPSAATRRPKLPVKTNIASLQQHQLQQQQQPMGKLVAATPTVENAMQPTFASVHRPRQLSTVAAIKRTGSGTRADLPMHQQQQQKHAGAIQLVRRQDSARTDSMNDNKAGIFNQPAAGRLPFPVQIPDPYATASFFGHQQQQHQTSTTRTYGLNQQPIDNGGPSQKPDYLLQNNSKSGVNHKQTLLAGSSQSGPAFSTSNSGGPRLPKQPASKLAPKQLNDIYEKHLLNQTIFDDQPSVSDGMARRVQGFGRSHQNQPPSSSSPAHPVVVGKFSAKEPPAVDNLYESIRSNYHIYEKIPETATKRGSRVEQYVRPLPPLQPRPKSLPVGAMTLSLNGRAQQSPYKLTSPEVLRAMQSPVGPNLSPIAEKPPNSRLPVNVNSSGGTMGAAGHANKSVITADGINIALETAKALATAAYIERAAQRLASGSLIQQHQNLPQSQLQQQQKHHAKMNAVETMADIGGFCGAIQRTPPPVPAGLARRMANREVLGLGKESRNTKASRAPTRTDFDFWSPQQKAKIPEDADQMSDEKQPLLSQTA